MPDVPWRVLIQAQQVANPPSSCWHLACTSTQHNPCACRHAVHQPHERLDQADQRARAPADLPAGIQPVASQLHQWPACLPGNASVGSKHTNMYVSLAASFYAASPCRSLWWYFLWTGTGPAHIQKRAGRCGQHVCADSHRVVPWQMDRGCCAEVHQELILTSVNGSLRFCKHTETAACVGQARRLVLQLVDL
jgi:hypothetical protein